MANRVATSGERIKELAKILGISYGQMSLKTGIEKSSISNYASGRRLARQDRIHIIAQTYDVSPAWLMGYDVPMRETATTDRLLEYYKKLCTLTEQDQEIVFNQIDFLRERKNENNDK